MHVHQDDDSADYIQADRNEPPLVADVVVHGDGIGVEEHAFRVGETHAMLAEVRLSLARIPDGHHVCIIYIQSTPSKAS